eukprot:9004718-Pyramimonas_sp.AAC.1
MRILDVKLAVKLGGDSGSQLRRALQACPSHVSPQAARRALRPCRGICAWCGWRCSHRVGVG